MSFLFARTWRALVLSLLLIPSAGTFAANPSLAAADFHSLLLRSDGTVRAWGWNNGMLGDGTTDTRLSPISVPAFANVHALSAGEYHTLAVKNNGTVWAWGYNGSGELGNGTTANRTTPTAIPGLTGAIGVAAGYSHSLALLSNGGVRAWGHNGNGQLGDGTTTQQHGPVTVAGLSGAAGIATRYFHSLAVKGDGSVMAWGWNDNGQLGDGTTTQRLSPVAVPGLSNAIAVAAGQYHSLALQSDGTVMAWGFNGYGQLGDGSFVDRLIPTVVPGLSGVIAIAAGNYHSLALKSDGTVVAWGANDYGQLGDGTITLQVTPISVSGLSGIDAIAAGGLHSLAVAADGTVRSWGWNDYGELGIGTTATKLNPTVIDDLFPSAATLPSGWSNTAGSGASWASADDQAFAGPQALKSGTIGNSAHSGIRYNGNFRAGTVTFQRKVSSESGADWLRFYVDGTLQGEWSGEADWTRITASVTAGVHELAWKYEKNGSASAGADAVWIDSVELPIAFNDVAAAHWAFAYVNALKDAGITTGCGNGNYCPGQNVDRQQMAAFIIRAVEGEPAACASAPFSDVPAGHSFCKYIQRMKELNITTGCGGGNYCPGQYVDRQQIAAFIIRAAEGEPTACASAPFSDIPPGHTFCKYIQRMKELNITTGCGGGNYCPTQSVTREQMAAFLARAFLGM